MAEQQRCMIEFCVQLGESGSEIVQLTHQAYETSCSFQVVEVL